MMYVCSIPKESCISDTTELLLELQRHQTAERFKEVVVRGNEAVEAGNTRLLYGETKKLTRLV